MLKEFKLYGTVLETPLLYYVKHGDLPYTCFSIAVGEDFSYEGKDVYEVHCLKNIAEDVCKNLKRGNKCLVKGRLETMSGSCFYENSYRGVEDEVRNPIILIAERVEYI